MITPKLTPEITPKMFDRAEDLRADMARRMTLCHQEGNTPAAFCVSAEDVKVLRWAACLTEGEEDPLFLGIKVLPFELKTYCYVNVEGGAYVIREESRPEFEPVVRAGGFTGEVVGIHPGEVRLIAEPGEGEGAALDGSD
jgi:hypothetical protein